MSELVNAYRNEKTLSYQPLTNLDSSNPINSTQESWCFGNQDSISSHPFELDQNQNFENHIDILESHPFSVIELENECNPEGQLGNSILLLDSIVTPVSLPNFNHFSESVLNLVPVHREIYHQSFNINILNLTNIILLRVPLIIWQVFSSLKLNSNWNVTPILNL